MYLSAQKVDMTANDHHEIGLTVGLSNYYGDLQPKLFPNYGYNPMVGIVYKYFMSPHVGLRASVCYTNLEGADSLSPIAADRARNLSFGTHLLEGSGILEINILPVDILRRKVTPYVFGGLSVFYFDPYAYDALGNKIYLRPLSTEGEGLPMYPDRKQYSLVNLAFPFGGGFKFFIGQRIMLTAEMGFRYTNTDYLDDVSKSYVNPDTLQKYKGKLARQMADRGIHPAYDYHKYGDQRGDPTSNDWYWWGNVTATIYFHSFGNPKEYLKTKCPGIFR